MQPVAAPARSASATAVPAVAEAVGISKRFGPTVALNDVTLAVRAGQSHALVGRNGAGKSTLVAILTGMVAPDEGAVRFNGQPAPSLSDRGGWRRNVACVYQRTTIVPALSVAENLFINRQSEGSVISWRSLYRRASDLLEEYGVDTDAASPAGELDVETRQLVEIARALSMGARFIILDEPTAQLDGAAGARLFGHVRRLQSTGATFLFISHHLHEIYEICETVTVLRDARHIVTCASGWSAREHCGGDDRRAREVVAPTPPAEGHRVPVLEVDGLAGGVRERELLRAAGRDRGNVRRSGHGRRGLVGPVRPGARQRHDPHQGRCHAASDVPAAIARRRLPAARPAGEGIVPLRVVGENLTLPLTDGLGPLGFIALAPRRDQRGSSTARRRHRGSSPAVSDLSGGNQQKVVMGRALSTDPRVLVLIDPTAGVDVRSKESLLSAVEQSAREGRAVVMVTDEIEDLRRCDRVLVMYRGQIVRSCPPVGPKPSSSAQSKGS